MTNTALRERENNHKHQRPMINATPRKHLVVLSQYNYERDLNIRLLLTHFDEIHRAIVEEILNGSLQASIKHLSQIFSVPHEELISFLNTLQAHDLFKINGDKLLINKEMRKYFSFELEKFDPDFESDLSHLQALLNKVPIHILPQWYAISRTSDNIFESIVERYFATPKAYQKHIDELRTDSPLIYKAYKALLEADDFCLPVETLMKRFNFTREQFEHFILEFEYNLCGCLCFKPKGKKWNAFVTLMHEWKTFLNILKTHRPQPLNTKDIDVAHAEDFYFVDELSKLVEYTQENFPIKKMQMQLPLFEELHDVASDLGLLQSPDSMRTWLRKTKQEQASKVYQLLLNYTRGYPEKITHCTEREFREICNALKYGAYQGWISFDDFMKVFQGIIRSHAPIELQKKGKKWRYVLPQYSELEKAFVESILFDHLWKAGIISAGKNGDAVCFLVTPYGRTTLGY